jgi:tetratricopeptide (TPR) repeat protein
LLSALPAGDVTRAITSAREAARAATRIGAHSDACVLLRRAFEALQLRPEIDPHTACELLYDLARFERAAGEPAFAAHLDQAVALARRHGFADVLVGASQVASGPPGTVSIENANDILEAALHALPASERGQRAMLLAHLSWTPPHSWKKQRVEKLLEEAMALAETSGNASFGTVLRAQLYYSSGPDEHERALAIASQMERLVSSSGKRQRARWALEPEIARILVQLQRGDLTQAQRAIDSFSAAAHELHHAELIWHAERFAVILRMNRGDYAYARTRLTELKKRADQLQLHARKTVEFADWGELLRRTEERAPSPAAVLTSQIRPVPNDGPMTHAGKLRVMTLFGLLDDARTELNALPMQDLYDLPKSRDYLATLGHFAHVAIATGSQKPAAALYELLLPYPHLCMATVSLHVFGPVARTLGGLARILGQRRQAIAHFEMAVHDSERFGLLPELAQARYQYAQLLAEGDGGERKEAREHSTRAREIAQQLGMKPLQTACEQLLGEVA